MLLNALPAVLGSLESSRGCQWTSRPLRAHQWGIINSTPALLHWAVCRGEEKCDHTSSSLGTLGWYHGKGNIVPAQNTRGHLGVPKRTAQAAGWPSCFIHMSPRLIHQATGCTIDFKLAAAGTQQPRVQSEEFYPCFVFLAHQGVQ